MSEQRRKFIIEGKRDVRTIIIGKKHVIHHRKRKLLSEKKDNARITSLIGQVSKAVNNFLIKNDFQVEKVPQHFQSTGTNRRKYNRMKEGTVFYYVDISHCFWRIAFLKNYIGERLYKNVLEKPGLKLYRNMALGCIVSEKWREYYNNGKFVIKITEDRTLHQRVYDNIRFTCYNLMGYAASLTVKNCIAYRTDGIMVDKAGLPKVKKLIRAQNYDFTVKECIKVDNLSYLSGGRTKKM